MGVTNKLKRFVAPGSAEVTVFQGLTLAGAVFADVQAMDDPGAGDYVQAAVSSLPLVIILGWILAVTDFFWFPGGDRTRAVQATVFAYLVLSKDDPLNPNMMVQRSGTALIWSSLAAHVARIGIGGYRLNKAVSYVGEGKFIKDAASKLKENYNDVKAA